MAAAHAPVLPYLKRGKIPVYLPGWLPAATAGEYCLLGAHATANRYKLAFDLTNHATPVNGPGDFSMAGMLGWVQGGPAGSRNPSPRQLWTHPHCVARSIRLPGGHPATFYLNWGIRWRQDGWTHSVVSESFALTGTKLLMPLVKAILAAVGPAGNRIGRGTTGQLFQGLAADNAARELVWSQGGHPYEIYGYRAPAIHLARSLVRVR